MKVIHELYLSEEPRALLVELLEERKLNIGSHRQALAELPELAVVSGEGYAALDAQEATVDELLEMLR